MPKHPSERKWVMFQNVKMKDTHPDYRGEFMYNGELMEIVGWIQRDKNGNQFLSGSVHPLTEELKPGPRKDPEKDEINGNQI